MARHERDRAAGDPPGPANALRDAAASRQPPPGDLRKTLLQNRPRPAQPQSRSRSRSPSPSRSPSRSRSLRARPSGRRRARRSHSRSRTRGRKKARASMSPSPSPSLRLRSCSRGRSRDRSYSRSRSRSPPGRRADKRGARDGGRSSRAELSTGHRRSRGRERRGREGRERSPSSPSPGGARGPAPRHPPPPPPRRPDMPVSDAFPWRRLRSVAASGLYGQPSSVVTLTSLCRSLTEEELRAHLSPLGASHVRLVRNLPSGESMGIAHVRFASRGCAAECVDAVAAALVDPKFGLHIRSGGAPNARVEARFNYQMESELSQLAEDAALASMAAHQAYGADYRLSQHQQQSARQQRAHGAGAGVGGSSLAQQQQANNGYIYDAQSGYYYDPASGYYVDTARGLFYHASTQAWYSYDAATGTYHALSNGGSAGQPHGEAPVGAAGGAAAAAAPAAAAAAPEPAAPAPPAPVTLGGGSAPVKLALSLGARKTVKLKAAGRPPSFAVDHDDGAPAAADAPAPPPAAAAPECTAPPLAGAPAAAAEGPEVPPEHLELADFQALVCMLCERRLPSALLLRRHLVESALHRDKYAQLCKRRAAESEYTRHLEDTRNHAVGSMDGTAGRPLTK